MAGNNWETIVGGVWGRPRESAAAISIDITGDEPNVDIDGAKEVPFLDLGRVHAPIGEAILAAWRDILRTGVFVGGPHVAAFEAELARFVGVGHAVGVANGTDAIALGLRALGLAPGDEVITAANTFFATVEGIVQAGGSPVLVDVEPESATIDPVAVDRAVTSRTRFVVPVHLYGQPADMAGIAAVAEVHGLRVLEDNAQALGAWLRGRRTGSLGHAAATSFYPGKNLGALGDGGAVTTDDPDVAARVRLLAQHGQVRKYEHVEVGVNSRLDAVQAAALRLKLPFLDAWNDDRRLTARIYSDFLAGEDVELPGEADGRHHVYHLFVIRHEERDRLAAELAERGISTGLHYPTPIHLTRPFRHLGNGVGSFPVAERWARTGLSLPMFPGMRSDEILATVLAVSRTGRRAVAH